MLKEGLVIAQAQAAVCPAHVPGGKGHHIRYPHRRHGIEQAHEHDLDGQASEQVARAALHLDLGQGFQPIGKRPRLGCATGKAIDEQAHGLDFRNGFRRVCSVNLAFEFGQRGGQYFLAAGIAVFEKRNAE